MASARAEPAAERPSGVIFCEFVSCVKQIRPDYHIITFRAVYFLFFRLTACHPGAASTRAPRRAPGKQRRPVIKCLAAVIYYIVSFSPYGGSSGRGPTAEAGVPLRVSNARCACFRTHSGSGNSENLRSAERRWAQDGPCHVPSGLLTRKQADVALSGATRLKNLQVR